MGEGHHMKCCAWSFQFCMGYFCCGSATASMLHSSDYNFMLCLVCSDIVHDRYKSTDQ